MAPPRRKRKFPAAAPTVRPDHLLREIILRLPSLPTLVRAALTCPFFLRADFFLPDDDDEGTTRLVSQGVPLPGKLRTLFWGLLFGFGALARSGRGSGQRTHDRSSPILKGFVSEDVQLGNKETASH